MTDRHKRTLMKTISWRVIGLFYTLGVLWAWGDGHNVIVLALVLNIPIMLLYYGHERIWNKIHWGRHKKETIM
jgi:uncharacterized membrane protein